MKFNNKSVMKSELNIDEALEVMCRLSEKYVFEIIRDSDGNVISIIGRKRQATDHVYIH